jgi:hypothetical protein
VDEVVGNAHIRPLTCGYAIDRLWITEIVEVFLGTGNGGPDSVPLEPGPEFAIAMIAAKCIYETFTIALV